MRLLSSGRVSHRWVRALLAAALAAWFAAMMTLGVLFMSKHWLPLPRLRDATTTGAGIAALRRPEDRGRWIALHVLGADCPCSLRIGRYLARAERPAGIVDIVLFVGSAPEIEQALSGHDVRVEHTSAHDLERRFAVSSAPLLIVASPDGELRYAGGYTERKQGLDVRDIAIITDLRAAREVPSLPVFGCALSSKPSSTQRVLSVL